VQGLLQQLHRLVAAGHTVVVVEHDLDVIATADWVIDLGPGGGDEGGRIVAAGPPAAIARAKGSATAPYLERRLA
jgi:excinuclease ABC subunit A